MLGGGVGVISSELEHSNYLINLDSSFVDLKQCNQNYGEIINSINGSMTELPFKEDFFDSIICAHILAGAKENDIKNNLVIKDTVNQYPTVEKTLKEIQRVLKNNGILFLTASNNAYYKSSKLTYQELTVSLKRYFPKYTLSFYNTYPRFSKKYRKLNFANIFPKFGSKMTSWENQISKLAKKDVGKKRNSVSFIVTAQKIK